MRDRTAILVALMLTGKYDTDEQYMVKGTDQYGKPATETVKGIDWERLDRDTDKILAKN